MRIKDSPETGITMEPSPKGWLWALAGVVVLGGVGTGAWFATHHAPHKSPVAAKAPHPAKKATASTSTVSTTPPNNYVAAPPQGVSLFTQMATINNKYIAWADQEIHAQVPQIPATGPNAGALTPAVLNNPAVIAKWGGPPVPSSLAGIKLPLGTPANGNFVGLTPQFLDAELADNHGAGSIPGLTAPLLQQAITTAGDFIMAINSSNPASALQYVDPYSGNGQIDQEFLNNGANPNYPIIKYFTASKANGGMLPWRQVEYDSWISVTFPYHAAKQFTVLFSATIHHPSGHVIMAMNINNLTFHEVGSGLNPSHLIVGQYVAPIGMTQVALIQSGSQTRWYVTNMASDGFGNTPSAVYWTAP